MASTFAIQIDKFAKKAGANARAAVRQIVLDLASRVILKSPVGNADRWKPLPSGKPRRPPPGYVGGRFRSNWQTTVGSPARGVLDRTSGSGSEEAGLMLSTWSADGSAFIVNNLPYAEAIENGHSTVAPKGVVSVTLAEFRGIVKEVAAKVRRRKT